MAINKIRLSIQHCISQLFIKISKLNFLYFVLTYYQKGSNKSMKKPHLQHSLAPSTALSKNILTATMKRTQTSNYITNRKESIYPSITPFNNVPTKSLKFVQKTIPTRPQIKQQTIWQNTADLQAMIKRRIQVDSELSTQTLRNFNTQKFILGPDRICTQKTLPIPQPVIEDYRNASESTSQKVNFFYGYLKEANIVYYIVKQNLYLFNLQDLKDSKQRGRDIFIAPIQIRQNCRKIYQIQIFNNNLIPKDVERNILIFQYPYEIQICAYKFQSFKKPKQFQVPTFGRITVGDNTDRSNEQNYIKNSIKMISLDTKIPLETSVAEFISSTSYGDLIYLDSNGLLNCFSFSGKYDSRIKSKTKQQTTWKKQTFLARNKGVMKTIKDSFWKVIDFRHCIYLSKKKNLGLVYDEKRNRIYSLTLKGDRDTMVQKLNKQIKVYNLKRQQKDVKIQCIWCIKQQELIAQINQYSPSSSKIIAQIFSIQKVQVQYNLQLDLIVMLSNGIKVFLQITQKSVKINRYILPPDLQRISQARSQRNQNLMRMGSMVSNKEVPNIADGFKYAYKIKSMLNNETKTKVYFNDRGLEIAAIKYEKEVFFYMTTKDFKQSQNINIMPIKWVQNDSLQKSDSFPSQNQLYQRSNLTITNRDNENILKLQKDMRIRQFLSSKGFDINRRDLSYGHQLMRQVYCGPRIFAYLSNKFLANLYLLRPVDCSYYLVTSKDLNFCQIYLRGLLGLEIQQLCCVLLQLYSDTQGIYYVSQHYKTKINNFYSSIKQDSKNYGSVNKKLLAFSKYSNAELEKKKKKEIFQQKQQDQVIKICQQLSEENKIQVQKLFTYFCQRQKQAKLLKQGHFIRGITISSQIQSSCSYKEQIQKLNPLQRIQVQNSITYISRILYPFWNCQIHIYRQESRWLKSIKQKVGSLLSIVDLLIKQNNSFGKHLQTFISKIMQILNMVAYVYHIPINITLQQAVGKNYTFFEQFIFSTLRRQMSPQIIFKYKQQFPLYISKQFQLLVKLYIEIKQMYNVEEIKRVLHIQPYYPQYFISYLNQDKQISDLSFLKIKDQYSSQITILNLPNLPFQNLLSHIYAQVKNKQYDTKQKYLYLKQAKKRIDQCRDPNSKSKQIVNQNTIERIKSQHEQLYKKLKLQEQIKSLLYRQIKQTCQKQAQKSQNIIIKVLSKLKSRQSSSQTQKGRYDKQNHMSISNQLRKLKNPELEQYLNDLQYDILQKNQLHYFCQFLNCSRLRISYKLAFTLKQYMTQNQIRQFRENMYEYYLAMVRQGINKYQIDVRSAKTIQTSKFQQFIKYLKLELKQLFIFANSINSKLDFVPIYDGIKSQLVGIEDYVFSLKRKNADKYKLSIAREFVQFGYDKKTITDFILYKLDQLFMNEQVILQEVNKWDEIQKFRTWIYDFIMMYDMCLNIKKEKIQVVQKLYERINVFYFFINRISQHLNKINFILLKRKQSFFKIVSKHYTDLLMIILHKVDSLDDNFQSNIRFKSTVSKENFLMIKICDLKHKKMVKQLFYQANESNSLLF